MKFNDFLKFYSKAQFIDSSTFSLLSEDASNLRRQVRYWSKKGYLICLKRGLYVFNENYRKKELSRLFLANFLVSPSYVSLEYALGFYGLIPEKVTVLTSITTKKTQSYKNPLGIFEYHSVKKGLFFGYKRDSDGGQDYFIALPEKALLDYFYFARQIKGDFGDFEAMRLQNLETLSLKKLILFSSRYNPAIKKVVSALIAFIKKYKKSLKVLK